MLRISRPKEVPSFLRSPRVLEERKNLLTYLRRDHHDRRQRRDPLNDDIFFEPDFRREIEYAFNAKCAFCETLAYKRGQILHLRPLRFTNDESSFGKDYYLWLAFEWRNIFYACDYCVKAKGNSFPVEGDRSSYLATFDDVVDIENSQVVDPTRDDPAKHLRFLSDGNVVAITPKGRVTIDLFKLNRSDLVFAREELMSDLFDFFIDEDLDFDLHKKVNSHAAHFGAVLSFLKRVSIAWFPVDQQIKGSGDSFVKNFEDAWRRSSGVQRERLKLAFRQVEESDNEARIDADFQYVSSSFNWVLTETQRPIEREISYIEIFRFRAIERLEFNIPSRRSEKSGMPALMVLGENSTGKSSALAAIALALIGRKEASKLKKFMPRLVHSSNSNRFDQLDELSVKVSVGFHFSPHHASFTFQPEFQLIEGSEEPSMIVLGYGPRRFFDTKKSRHIGGAAARVRTLFDPLATIPYPGDWLRAQTGRRFDTIAAALRVVLALDDDDELIVEPEYIAVRANGRITPIDALSEGYRSVFVMTVDIIRELLDHWVNLEHAQAIVLIDELETHLHPRWKMQVMTSLRRVFPRVQFIVTTHDPLCLRGMDDGEVVVLQRDENNFIHKVSDLPSVSGMTAEQLLTSDYFGLASTTDPSTELALAKLAGDVVRRNNNGEVEVAVASTTMDLVSRLMIGESQSQQVVQEALLKYLKARELQAGSSNSELRGDAVDAIVDALVAGKEW